MFNEKAHRDDRVSNAVGGDGRREGREKEGEENREGRERPVEGDKGRERE